MANSGYGAKPRGFLPRDPRVEEPYRLTPQMAFRIGILGALALAAFALLILRLWALQVLSGDDYLRAAARQPAAPGARSRRPAARSSTATGSCWSTTAPSPRSASGRRTCPRRAACEARDAAAGTRAGRPAGRGAAEAQAAEARPADADHDQGQRPAREDHLPRGAPDRVPRRQDRADAGAALPLRRARGADPRLRRRDQRAAAEGAEGLPPRRPDRPARRRVGVRRLPARHGRARPGTVRLGGPAAQRPADHAGCDAGRRGAADARRGPAEGGRGGDRLRHGPGREERQLVLARRRRRGDRPAQRRRARARVGAELPSRRLRELELQGRAAGAPRPAGGGRRARQLPAPRPGDRGPVSAGVDVQAGDGAGGHPGRAALAVRVDQLPGGVRPPQAGRDADLRRAVQQLERLVVGVPDACHGARAVVRHVLLRARQALLRHAGQPAIRSRSGPRAGASVTPTGLDIGGEAERPPADARVAKEDHFSAEIDKLWKPGDSLQLAIGQRRPTGHAAADDAVLRDARQQRPDSSGRICCSRSSSRARGAPGRSSCAATRRRRRGRAGSTRRRCRSSSRGSYDATHGDARAPRPPCSAASPR